jgi:hypothetical protein
VAKYHARHLLPRCQPLLTPRVSPMRAAGRNEACNLAAALCLWALAPHAGSF